MSLAKRVILIIISLSLVAVGIFYLKHSNQVHQKGMENKPVSIGQSTEPDETQQETKTLEAIPTDTYSQIVSDFIALDSNTFMEELASDKLKIVYMGRESCPHCREFAPKLAQALKSLTDIKLYYLDSDISTDTIIQFAQTNNITTVPQLMKIKQGQVIDSLAITPETGSENIKAFILNH